MNRRFAIRTLMAASAASVFRRLSEDQTDDFILHSQVRLVCCWM